MPKTKFVTSWEEIPLIVDVPFVSVLLGVHPRTVERKLISGELKGVKMGKFWRIPKQNIAEYMGIELGGDTVGTDNAVTG